MLVKDAASILGLSGLINLGDVKAAYRAAARKYHPDKNPAGEHMMKMVNAAYEVLKGFTGTVETDDVVTDYPEALAAAIDAIIDLDGLEIEICGAWIWVGGATRPHSATFKAAGYRWASKKKKWNFRPNNWKSTGRGKMSMDDIREKYGTRRPCRQKRQTIEASAV